jgi:DNA-binding PadR family transcriptional regulator
MVRNRRHLPAREGPARLPLRPSAYAVLAALAGGPRPGIDILERVRGTRPGVDILGPGTLYRVMRELRHAGLIARSHSQPALGLDDRQTSHELTPAGRRVLDAETERLARTIALARRRPRRTGAS